MRRLLFLPILAAVAIGVFLLLGRAGSGEGSGEGPAPPPEIPAVSAPCLSSDEAEVRRVVGEAAAADNYLTVTTKEDLRACLARIYAGPLLERLTDAVWESWGSDNTGGATITDWLELRFEQSQAHVIVALCAEDWATGDRVFGEGYFTLMRLAEGWRVVEMDYRWSPP